MGNYQSENLTVKQNPGKTIEVLYKISEAVSITRNLDELYKVIHESLTGIINVDNFYIALHHEKKDSITFPYYIDEKDDDPEEINHFSKRPSLTGRVIEKRKPLIFYEAEILRMASLLNQDVIGTVCKIWLGAPLMINGRVKGVIVIQSYSSPDAYERNDLDLLNSVSQHIALAIERKESEEMLTAQQRVLEKIIESSPVGIALIQNRRFKWVNNEMVHMFGYQSKKDFENKSTRMIYCNRDDYHCMGEKIYESLSSQGLADHEIDMVRKDHSCFPAHIRLSANDVSNPEESAIATFTDISQRKIVEREKYEKERLQGVLEMAGAVCHEINQPLQAITGYSDLLLMGSGSDKDIDSIRFQVDRLGKITQKLSNITRYRTVNYSENIKIVDIWGSSRHMKE